MVYGFLCKNLYRFCWFTHLTGEYVCVSVCVCVYMQINW